MALTTLPSTLDRPLAPDAARGARTRWSKWGLRGLQAALATLFLFAGASKLLMPPEAMQADIALPLWFLRGIGALEALGALGLVLPPLTGIAPRLVPLAASGLIAIMIGAVIVSALAMGIGAAVFPFAVGLLLVVIVRTRTRALSEATAVGA